MKVHISSILFQYTQQKAEVSAQGRTLNEVFEDLERQFPGLRFRVIDERNQFRAHIKVFVTDHWSKDLQEKVKNTDEIHIIGALSGGL